MTTVPVPEDVQDAFDYFDDNKSGFLDYVQLHNALQHYTFETNIDEAIELVHTHDIDGDGKLNLVRAHSHARTTPRNLLIYLLCAAHLAPPGRILRPAPPRRCEHPGGV